jgi:hypothetical protein
LGEVSATSNGEEDKLLRTDDDNEEEIVRGEKPLHEMIAQQLKRRQERFIVPQD